MPIRIFRKLRRGIFERQVYLVYGKTIEGLALPPSPAQVVFDKVENIGAEDYRRCKHMSRYLRWQDWAKDVRAKHELFLGRHAGTGEVVFYIWTRTASSLDSEAGITVSYPIADPDEVHFFSAYTHPAFRGRGIYAAGIRYIKQYYGRVGFKRISCTVRPGRLAATKAIARIGFVSLGIRVIGTRWFSRKSYRLLTGELP